MLPVEFRMDKDTVHIVAHIVARKGEEREIQEELEKLVEPSRAEPGCMRYELLVNQDNPGAFVFLQEYRSDEAFQLHMDSKHIRAALADVVPRLLVPPEIGRYRRVLSRGTDR